MIRGLSHITLIVADLDRSAALYASVFGARELYDSGDEFHSRSREKFLSVNGLWIAIMQGDPPKTRSYNHIAFGIDENGFDEYVRRIRGAGLEILPDRPRIPGEGRSVYFYDYDNHLFELHTGTLEERLAVYGTE